MFPKKAPPKSKPFPGAPNPGGPPERAGLSAPSPVERKGAAPDDESAEDPIEESTETPEAEATEDQGEYGGTDIIKDLAAVGQNYGADEATSRELAADFLDAIGKCLRGNKVPDQPVDGGDGGEEFQA